LCITAIFIFTSRRQVKLGLFVENFDFTLQASFPFLSLVECWYVWMLCEDFKTWHSWRQTHIQCILIHLYVCSIFEILSFNFFRTFCHIYHNYARNHALFYYEVPYFLKTLPCKYIYHICKAFLTSLLVQILEALDHVSLWLKPNRLVH
jgi:hypothetical protein